MFSPGQHKAPIVSRLALSVLALYSSLAYYIHSAPAQCIALCMTVSAPALSVYNTLASDISNGLTNC